MAWCLSVCLSSCRCRCFIKTDERIQLVLAYSTLHLWEIPVVQNIHNVSKGVEFHPELLPFATFAKGRRLLYLFIYFLL